MRITANKTCNRTQPGAWYAKYPADTCVFATLCVAGQTDDDIQAVAHYYESAQEQPGKEKINTQPGPIEGIGKPEPLN